LNTTITNNGHAMSCNFQMQLNYTYASAAYAGWTYYGCDIWNPPAHTGCTQEIPSTVSCLTKQYYWSFLISIPWQQGVLSSAKDYACTSVGAGDYCWHIQANIQTEQWDSEECLPIVPSDVIHQSPQCAQWFSNYKAQVQAGSGGSPVSFGAFTPIVTFLIGVIFFFMGLGINFTMGGSILGSGTTFGAGSNRQGTKLFQVLGLGLLVWSIFYSEFATWFTSSLLPYGFDGPTGIISVLLTGLFFFGVYEWATTG
ncbi:MAG: hypothetical protein KGH74_05605, partial [Candidatus Micrarchaeota archaeon]|nr:hypothetical protein [Candidatus Micrarchaeota archaeon]